MRSQKRENRRPTSVVAVAFILLLLTAATAGCTGTERQ